MTQQEDMPAPGAGEEEDARLPVLYWVNGSIPSWQVMCVLEERGIAYEPRRLRVMGDGGRETRTPQFLALNPYGQAPVWVEHDGFVLRESLAIVHYLDRTRPWYRQLLYTGDLLQEGRILQVMYELDRLRQSYRPLERLFLGEDALSVEELERARLAPDRVHAELAYWEELLGDAPFVVGDTLTLADCMFWPVLGYQLRRGLDLSSWPALQAYAARCRERPSFVRAHPQGWETRVRGKKDLFAIAKKR